MSALLDIPFEEVKDKIVFKSLKKTIPRIREKRSEKDVVFLVDISEPLKIGLEMNKYNVSEPIIIRNTFYQSDVFISGLESGSPYNNIVDTIQFNFNPNFIDEVNKPLVDEYYYSNKNGHILTTKNKIVHLNVVKMSDMWYNLEYKRFPEISPLLFLLSAIIVENEKNKFEELLKNDLIGKEIGKAIERIVFNMNKDIKLVSRYYDFEEDYKEAKEAIIKYETKKAREKALNEGLQEGLKRGIEEGFEQGIEKNTREMVINMYKENISLDIICKCSKLDLEKVKEIIKNN